MPDAQFVSVEKESTLLNFVKETFVVPKTGAGAAAKQAAAELAASNPQLANPKKAPRNAHLFVPADFPLKLRTEAAPVESSTSVELITRLKSEIPELRKLEDQRATALIAGHKTTLELLDSARNIGEGTALSARVDAIQIVAEEAIHQAEVDLSERQGDLDQLDAALQEMIEFLKTSGR